MSVSGVVHDAKGRPESGVLVWAGSYAKKVKSIYELYAEVALDIADAIEAEVTGEERKRIADDLSTQKLDAAVLTQTDSIAWLLNIRGDDVPFTPVALCFAIINAGGGVDLFIDAVKLSGDIKHQLGADVRCRGLGDFGAALDELGKRDKTVRLNPETAAAWGAGAMG